MTGIALHIMFLLSILPATACDGNRIGSVRVKDPADEPMENQTVIHDNANMYGYGFEYDPNGNLVSDPGRGITEIVYSESGCPLSVTFQDDEQIRYAYTATGEKLRETYEDSDGTVIRTRDLRGNFEFADGALERVQIEDGYLNATGEYVVSVKDYQGNVVAQINASTDASLQHTDYYPYGLPMGISTGAEQNRRKFGDKEYTSEFGFASSDLGARLYSPLYGSFASPDPKAGDYTPLSPYAYCASDPVNYIDPSGEVIIFVNGYDKLGANPAGKPYWTNNGTNYSFVNGAAKYFSDNKIVYLPMDHTWSSSADKRKEIGYNIGLSKSKFSEFKDDPIRIVTHSMGAATGEGLASALIEKGYNVTDIVHINPYQAADIKSVSLDNPNVKTIDYQLTNDPVTHFIIKFIKPILGNPGNIEGATFQLREKGNEKLPYVHSEPIFSGKKFWNRLKEIMNGESQLYY